MSHMITARDGMMSVREVPWHKHLTGDRTVVREQYPSTAAALEDARMGWRVDQEVAYRRVLLADPDGGDPIETFVPTRDADDVEWRYNVRSDTGGIVGVVTADYKPVQNLEAFNFLDALLGDPGDAPRGDFPPGMGDVIGESRNAPGRVQWETCGTLQGGKRVWVLARVPEHVTIAGDESVPFVYCANSHDGSMAVTAAATAIRIICANTLGFALRKSETGAAAARTYRFRHTGNLTAKFAEARRVMGLTVAWSREMKALGDSLGLVQLTDKHVTGILKDLSVCKVEEGMGTRKVRNREEAMAAIIRIYKGEGKDGDTRGNAPGTAWCLVNAIGEYADFHRRYTVKTDQVQRSFEDGALKQEGLDRVLAVV